MPTRTSPDAPAEWPRRVILDFAEVNPRYPLQKGHTYPFVEMAAVGEQFRGITRFDQREAGASGLAQFRLNDILFAKITPCPQNGKVAHVRTEEPIHDGQGSGAEETGSEAGSGKGRGAPAASGPTAHPFQSGLTEMLGLGDVLAFHRNARWVPTTSGPALLMIPVRLFASLPYRAVLYLEISTSWDEWRVRYPEKGLLVPPIRAWAWWTDGIRVRSHHENPDTCICACKSEDWGLGRALEDYIMYCTCWIAKVLHERLLGRWPGAQHYPAWIRMTRNRVDEYCGCGKRALYRDCCKEDDWLLGPAYHRYEHWIVQHDYFDGLRRCGLPDVPDYLAATFGISNVSKHSIPVPTVMVLPK